MSELVPMTLREQQLVELEIMKEIHRVCKEYNIRYWLMYGSLIGAVRHDGFIPWDDDIDIAMPRKDYNKFVEVCNKGVLNDKFDIQNYHTDPKFEFIISRVGMKGTYSNTESRYKMKSKSFCYIDIFPMENAPNDRHQLYKHMRDIDGIKKIKRLRMNYSYKQNGIIKKAIKYIVALPFKVLPIRWYAKKHEKIATRYNNDVTRRFVGLGGGYSYEKELQEWENVEQLLLHKFEDCEFWIPKGYNNILTNLYGDYMKLPPESERIVKHTAYWVIEK